VTNNNNADAGNTGQKVYSSNLGKIGFLAAQLPVSGP
jgi:hypothetical protein